MSATRTTVPQVLGTYTVDRDRYLALEGAEDSVLFLWDRIAQRVVVKPWDSSEQWPYHQDSLTHTPYITHVVLPGRRDHYAAWLVAEADLVHLSDDLVALLRTGATPEMLQSYAERRVERDERAEAVAWGPPWPRRRWD